MTCSVSVAAGADYERAAEDLVRRAGYLLAAIVLLGCAGSAWTLLARERGGPRHRDVTLAGDVPATFYLPDAGEPPPAVVVGHGYSGDRVTMSSLSRSLAEAGYAVLAIDFAGHGASPRSSAAVDGADELAAGLDWLEDSAEVDPDRLAVLGHSMGAYAVLELVAGDPRPSATVVFGSSRSTPFGGREPPNLLVLAGENDSSSVHSGSRALAERVDGARVAEIEGANHVSILWFDDTVAETVAWLDAVFGIQRETPAELVDDRLGVALLYFLFLPVAFAALGALAGKLGPRRSAGAPATLRTFALLAAALVVAAPVVAIVEPAGFFGAGFGDVVVYLAIAGALICLPQLRGTRSVPPTATLTRLAAAGLGCAVAMFVLLSPLGAVLHRLVPTLQRALLAGLMTPLLGLFFVQLQASVRRGSLVRSTSASAAAHFVVLLGLTAGVVLGVFPGVVGLALPLLAGVFGLVEVFGITAYAAGRNGVLVGVVESFWVAGLAAAVMPLP
ncbi:MAG TPA: alpha/beta fold hydrolase [Actinomycetota bacterium]|nr:alpha/beta fold hydrolase [Actinomycetota bacterium]